MSPQKLRKFYTAINNFISSLIISLFCNSYENFILSVILLVCTSLVAKLIESLIIHLRPAGKLSVLSVACVEEPVAVLQVADELVVYKRRRKAVLNVNY